MGKGLKIKTARLIDSGAIVNVNKFDIKERDNIECEYCKVKLKYTKSFWRNKDKDNRTWISSFFSLLPGKNHESTCKYNVKNAIDILVKESTSVENLDERTLFNDGISFQFRLHTLDELIKETKEKNSPKETLGEDKIGTAPKTIDRKLKPYLTTAKELAKLYSLIQSSEDKKLLQKKVFLKYKGRKIAWSSFVFETKQLHKLVSKNCYYPVAFILELQEGVETNTNRKNKHCVKAYSDIQADGITVPRIYFNDDSIIAKIKPKYQYLIIGRFDAKKGQEFNNLNIFINDKSQIIQLSDETISDPEE